AGASPRLVDPGQQEDLVVHAETEDDREHHHRHIALDRHRAGHPERGPAPAPLEHGHHDAVGRGEGQDVEDGRLDGDEQAAEDRQDDQERQGDHDADDQRQPVRDDVAEVDLGGGGAGDVGGGVRAPDGLRQRVVDQPVGEVGGGGALRRLGGVHRAHQHVPGLGGGGRGEVVGGVGAPAGLRQRVVDQPVGEVGGGGALRRLGGVLRADQHVPVLGGGERRDDGRVGDPVQGLLGLGGEVRPVGGGHR